MSSVSGISNPSTAQPDDGDGVRAVQIPPELRLAAAARLVSESGLDPLEAGKRFLESAKTLKIDLNLLWGVLDSTGTLVKQVCLGVVGSGRTAMLFVSGSTRKERAWTALARATAFGGGDSAEHALAERAACINAACDFLGTAGPHAPKGVVLAQALLEEREREVGLALQAAGFLRLGELAYMRRFIAVSGPGRDLAGAEHPAWPGDIRVRSVAELELEGLSAKAIDGMLSQALEASYIDTLDCPELCGLRDISDVLESHRSVGVFDPSLWWVITARGPIHGPLDPQGEESSHGCMLLSVCPEHESVELVYLGLSPALRGRGIGSAVLRFGLAHLFDTAVRAEQIGSHPRADGSGGVTCAVDTRNPAAMKLYRHAGFQRFGVRVPFVRSIGERAG